MTTKDVLIAAKAKVAQGWCQNVARDGKGGICAMEAVMDTDADADPFNGALHALYDANGFSALMKWNDAKGRTQADVLAAFDKAIALVEEQ